MITLTEQIGEPIAYCDSNPSFNIDPESIMVDIEGLHAVGTGNYTRYMPISLENSIGSWTHPYNRPVIMHHNEENGKIIGRIISVAYKSSGTRSGTPALVFSVNIPDEEGKKQIKDGRLLTVSVGINATDCRCSICGRNVAEYGPCEHKRGHEYDGETCYWDIYAFTGKELSYVITPSDPYTHNIKIYSPYDSNALKEQLDMNLTENLDTTIAADETQEVNSLQADSNNVNDQQVTPAAEQPLTESESQDESGAQTEEPAQEENQQEEVPQEETPQVEAPAASVPVTESELFRTALELREQLAIRTEELRAERSLRESLENDLCEIRTQYKIMLVSSINTLREKLGKPLAESDELMRRNEISLMDTIADYTSELELQESAAADESAVTDAQDPVDAQTEQLPLTESLSPVDNPAIVTSKVKDDKKEAVKSIKIAEQFYNLDKVLFSR